MRRLALALLFCVLLAGCGKASHPKPATLTFSEPHGPACVTRNPPSMGECVKQAMRAEGKQLTAPHAVAGPQGIDISVWQSYPDWPAAKRAGLTFVYNQATDNGYTDPNFDANTLRERNDRIPNGAYVYLQPGCDSADYVADHFAAVVKSSGGFDSLPPLLDQENNGCLASYRIAGWDCEVANRIRRDDGWSTVVLYTSPGLWPGGSTCGDYLDLADWGAFSLPSGWREAKFWQYCGQFCRYEGVEGYVDREVSLGGLALGRGIKPPPKPTPAQVKRQRERELQGDYALRSELRALLSAHNCRSVPLRAKPSAYEHACRVWLPQGAKVGRWIAALHRLDIW